MIKIEEIIRRENNFYDLVKISFMEEGEKYLLEADFDLSGDSKSSKLENIKIFKNDLELNLTKFNSRTLTLINDYFWAYLDKENDFLKYHYTGSIREHAYSDYVINYSIDKYPKIVLEFTDKNGETIQIRQTGESLKYVKKDENDEILRKDGEVVYLSEEEMVKKNLPLYDTSMVAFNSKGQSVALASDEWGADGIWVNSDYQKRGIGLMLLETFRKQFPENRKMGQMTPQGTRLVRALFRKNNL